MKKTFIAYYVAIINLDTKQALSITGPFETIEHAKKDNIWLTYNYQKTTAKIVSVQF